MKCSQIETLKCLVFYINECDSSDFNQNLPSSINSLNIHVKTFFQDHRSIIEEASHDIDSIFAKPGIDLTLVCQNKELDIDGCDPVGLRASEIMLVPRDYPSVGDLEYCLKRNVTADN
ncbi:hypothetical protein O9G_005708 [Rozella allomycis CSF55]|uniref:Uncharacterized protein n=1 Tax=Rozella allomycis (strain CSF55) TaxID=988480 RepID=A0A075ANJ6_ROZAC|nr:hypothetical protein O9G_005708 [Rozella allomycis CSF55]|eukprot:EPZ31437.1 hypothetical protein O9G_005708 [Rozella allomycis CSF55]